MASPPSFQVEDQTDEDFFDKLVDDDLDESRPNSEEISRVLSNLSIGDVNTSLEDSEVENPKQNSTVELSESPKSDLLAADNSLPVECSNSNDADKVTESTSHGSKGTSVKEVQWSAFSVDSQQFGKDFFEENLDGSVGLSSFIENPVENLSSNIGSSEQQHTQFYGSTYEQSTIGSSGQQDTQLYGLTGEQSTDPNDTQYWENLYPGWKYDPTTGQWYQLDNLVSENSNVESLNTPESLTTAVLDSSEISFLQQGSQSVLETIAEDCTVSSVSNWNQGFQGSMEYPPNMVFDPQYPEWYYDTYTQQWYTLESYTQGLCNGSNAVQGQLSQDVSSSAGFSSEQNHSLSSNIVQSEQQTIQGQSGQEFGGNCDASVSGYGQQKSLYDHVGQSNQHTAQGQDSQGFGGNWGASGNSYAQNSFYNSIGQSGKHTTQGQGNQEFGGNWDTPMTNYAQQNAHQNMWQPEPVSGSGRTVGFAGNLQTKGSYGSMSGNQLGQQIGFKTFEPVAKHSYGNSNGVTGFQGFAPNDSMYQFKQPKIEQSLQSHLSNSYYGDQNAINYPQQSFQSMNASSSQFPYPSTEGRSSAGRPPHALVAFGFGGQLIVMKDTNNNLDYGSQGNASGAVSILSLSEVVTDKSDALSVTGVSTSGYFHALCQQSFPGPLVGGNAAAKDVNKWLDERITYCESSSMDFRKGEFLRLLLSLLKILCQHYGKLRSPFGTDQSLEDIDGPESAVTKLFTSARKNGAPLTEYGSLIHCVQNIPSEGQIRATAVEVQNLLVSGRRKEALQCAQEGQLWGPALVLAAQLGEKFYVDTVKKMAHRQFICGSPLRTLCLLIAGQPADVFSAEKSADSFSVAANALHGPTMVPGSGMLDDWEENLAIITANRTKDDELVIIHLGDCLLKERGEITAAHTCYLVAEANFESYSDSARLCLIGADHWKCPRTYASPEAIQRTEVYEYSKVLGNSQFVLLPFQPYKLVYAYMLAEVGKVSDSLRYCQASLKLLKNSGRAPEAEMWKTMLSSLEERLRTHQQGGYSSNLAPAKLVGKLFTSLDRSIHRMIGAPPAPLPPMPQSSSNGKDNFSMVPKVASSQSTMAMSSLMPSASVEAISEWTGDGSRKNMHNRSISEPDFGRTPKQNSSKDADGQSKVSSGPSRIGRIGSQLLQKTMGWVSRSRSDRQAKLGESNKFYYDEKLKRWVEEGAEPPAEEAALPPPPTAVAFQNGTSDYNINSALKGQNFTTGGGPEMRPPISSEPNSGIPPIPPSQNQFSARGRMGVRSRYVDTFNKGGAGGALTNSFQSPSALSAKPPVGAKFFVPPTPAPSDIQTNEVTEEIAEEATINEEPSTSVAKEMPSSPPSTSSSSSSMPRFPSMDNLSPFGNKGARDASQSGNGLSRMRAASWSGTYTDSSNHKMTGLGGSPPQFLPKNQPSPRSSSSSSLQLNGSSVVDDLHEVEL